MTTNLERYTDQMRRRRLISRITDIDDAIKRCRADGDREQAALWYCELQQARAQLAALSSDVFSALPRSP